MKRTFGSTPVALVGLLLAVGCSSGSSSGGAAGADGGTATNPGGGNGGGANPPANAVTIGPDLRTLSGLVNEFGCGAGYPVQTNPTFPQPFLAGGQASCLVLTFLAPTGPSLGSGTAVSADIRVPGAQTGPMRFVRMRILYSRATGPKCCSLEEYGNEFTPRANGTTTVPLNFAMTIDPLPPENDTISIIANDLVALEVLSPDVPIPGYWPNSGGPADGTASYMWIPALSAQNAPAPSGQLLEYQGSYSGFVPLFTIAYVAN